MAIRRQCATAVVVVAMLIGAPARAQIEIDIKVGS